MQYVRIMRLKVMKRNELGLRSDVDKVEGYY